MQGAGYIGLHIASTGQVENSGNLEIYDDYDSQGTLTTSLCNNVLTAFSL